MILFLTHYLIFVLGLFIGMLMGHRAKQAEMPKQKERDNRITEYTEEVKIKTLSHQDKPGGIFKDEDAEIVERPSAQQIARWNEDPDKQESKEAIAETLSKDPNLTATKKAYDQFVGGLNE